MSDWPCDIAFELVKAGLLRGKSIGFVPLKLRAPTAEEIEKNTDFARVRYIIEEWLLAEYACCYLPMQPNAVVETVSKSVPTAWAELLGLPKAPSVAFTALKEIESAARRMLESQLKHGLVSACARAWTKAQGRVD